MRIAYILDDDISLKTGVVNKIISKISYWQQMGHTVKVFSLRSTGNISCIDNAIIISNLEVNKGLVYKFFKQFQNIKTLNRYLKEFNPDITYLRHMKYYLGIVSVLKYCSNYIVELNSNDLEESKKNSKLVYIYNKLTRGFLLKNSVAFISVSKELVNDKIFAKYSKPFTVIGNGYTFNNVFKTKDFLNDTVKFVFIGTPNQNWHGLDKVLDLVKILIDFEFHIIGTTMEELKLISNNIPSNITVYGYLEQDKAEKIVLNCDIGISTLALHRNNMNEASPLKSRQYLALGLPIIVGYKDTDLSADTEFMLNIGNYESNVVDSIDEIKDFVNKASFFKPKEIRMKSKKFLDYNEKEKQRIAFLLKYAKSTND